MLGAIAGVLQAALKPIRVPNPKAKRALAIRWHPARSTFTLCVDELFVAADDGASADVWGDLAVGTEPSDPSDLPDQLTIREPSEFFHSLFGVRAFASNLFLYHRVDAPTVVTIDPHFRFVADQLAAYVKAKGPVPVGVFVEDATDDAVADIRDKREKWHGVSMDAEEWSEPMKQLALHMLMQSPATVVAKRYRTLCEGPTNPVAKRLVFPPIVWDSLRVFAWRIHWAHGTCSQFGTTPMFVAGA